MIDNITYSQAHPADIASLVSLLSVLFNIEKDFNPDLSKQQTGLALLMQNQASATIQVAKNSRGQVIGMVTAQLVISTAQGAPSAWVEDMVVDAGYRGRGIGKELLQHTLAWAKAKGATRAQLLVDIENEGALGYYQHLNWQTTQLQARRVFF